MKVVSPYRLFPPESNAHLRLGAFDWQGALSMLRASVRASCGCETFAITDVDAALSVPCHFYETHERRLMLWILEVSLCYLDSSDFDQDTVMLSPDMMAFGDLRRFFTADLGIVVRPQAKYLEKPILNGAQWWSVDAKPRLVAFFREALDLAHTLPDETIRWGADTVPLVQLLAPVVAGRMSRRGLTVNGIDQAAVFEAFTDTHVKALAAGRAKLPTLPIVDFKAMLKLHMRAYFDATIGSAVPA